MLNDFVLFTKTLITNIIEKRDFIHNHLWELEESVVNDLYGKIDNAISSKSMLKEEMLARAIKAEDDIRTGRLFSHGEARMRIRFIN